MSGLTGHHAIVTGGARGIGAAIAEMLVQEGAAVTLIGRDRERLEARARALADRGTVDVAVCDVGDDASVTAAFAQIRVAHSRIDILVNCAGVGPAKRIVGKDGPQPLADFERVIAINLVGTFNMMRLFAASTQNLEPFTDGERGVVVSTASVAAYEGQIGQAAYSASKGGVAALTIPAAREFSQFGIRVMAIAPGIFGTPMLKALPQAAQDSLGASVPFPKRLGEPREFADLVLFIVRNGYLNGEVIRIDGALRMAPR